MAAVSFDKVSKVYPGPVHAVRELSLQVADGEFLVLVGPSGCGKSTVLRLVAGLEKITAGTVRIGDRAVNDVPPKDRNIAMVFQSYALYPHMTVAGNLGFALKVRKVPRDEITRRVSRTADMLGITDLLDRKPRALSGGQQQRVALGRAIIRQPQCFLFDEPLSNLDAQLRLQMRGELKALHQRLGTTTIHVTHDQEEAMTLGQRIVVLCDGRIQQVGEPLEVYRRPANSFVARFVGSPPMNLLEGSLAREGQRVWFDDGAGVRLPVDGADGRSHPARAVLGIRPEALALVHRDGEAQSSRVDGTVSICEPVGDRMDVHVTTGGGTTLVARIPATTAIAPGQPARLTVAEDAMHLFEVGAYGRRVE